MQAIFQQCEEPRFIDDNNCLSLSLKFLGAALLDALGRTGSDGALIGLTRDQYRGLLRDACFDLRTEFTGKAFHILTIERREVTGKDKRVGREWFMCAAFAP